MRPGTNVAVQTQTPPLTPPINTGTWFVAGITSQGPLAPQIATSFQQWQQLYGLRGTNPLTSDSVETYFAQGGSRVITARVVGPAAVAATIAVPTTSFHVTARGPGTYANGWKAVVAGAGPFTITIQDSSSNVLEVSNSLTSVADAVAYGQTSQYVTITADGVTLPTPATYTLTGGTDDNGSVSTAQYSAALALFTADLGPGQVSCPGVTTSAVQTALANHAVAFNRIAYCDLVDTTVVATLTGAATTITALGLPARVTALWTPWADIQPVTGATGLRAVPPSAFAAAKAAVIDALGNPNIAPAGINGILTGVAGLHATFIDVDRQTLNTAGINVIRPMAGGFRIYGNVTAVNRITDPLYFQLSNVRLDMAIVAEGQAIAEGYVFSQIDGLGQDAADYGNELVNMLTRYQSLGALFQGTDGLSFTVDVGPDVNPLSSEAQGILVATVGTVRSPGAEQVNLNIVRISVAQGL